MSKKAIAEIAIKEFVKRTNKDAGQYTTRFDGGNEEWNKYYLQYYPDLKGKNYQAIRLIKKQKEWIRTPTIGGGPNWMCIDRKTGQALAIYVGM